MYSSAALLTLSTKQLNRMNLAPVSISIAPSMLHKLDVPVAYFDDQLVCQYCNPAYAQYWQCPDEQLLQKPIYKAWKAHFASLSPYLEDVLRGTDSKVHLPAAAPHTAAATVHLIAQQQDGKPEGFCLVVYPEADTPSQIQQLQQEIESLAYSISHDFRAPLRHIEGFSRLLQNKVDTQDPDTLKYLDYIRSGATELSTMIDALLAYSRLGRRSIERTTLDMNALAQQALAEARALHRKRAIQWEVGALPSVYADEDMVAYLLELLIDNAVKFTQATPEARITIGAHPAEAGQPTVFFVQDNGIGFDDTLQDHLFGVFQRLHRHDDYPGLGIGLAQAKRIIQQHHGKIWATAMPQKGATFYFTLS